MTCKFTAGCGCWEGARRIVTILDVGRTCEAPILKVGVSCIEAISNEKVICTAACMASAGCIVPGAAGVLISGAAGGIWVGSGVVRDEVECGTGGWVQMAIG